MWSLGTWNQVRTVGVREDVPDAVHSNCLAKSGSMLLCGGDCQDDEDDESVRDVQEMVLLDVSGFRLGLPRHPGRPHRLRRPRQEDDYDRDVSGFVLVLDSETLTCEHTLRLDHSVDCLVSVRGEVWGQTRERRCVVVGQGGAGGGIGHERGRQGVRWVRLGKERLIRKECISTVCPSSSCFWHLPTRPARAWPGRRQARRLRSSTPVAATLLSSSGCVFVAA